MDKSTVWRHLVKAGMQTDRHFMSRNERLVAEVKVLHEAGLMLRQIASQVEVSHPTVYRLLNAPIA